MIISEDKNWFSFKITMELQKAFEAKGIFFTLKPGTYRFKGGEVVRAPKGPLIEPYVIFGSGDIFPAGFASYTGSRLPPDVAVGRYCSIAENVKIMGFGHPLDRVTTNSITYGQWSNIHLGPINPLGGGRVQIKSNKQKPPPVIGHDVWIGQDVLLARGITIGNGAVIAAGSVVTKDVPPYAILGGNPGRIIRFRFDSGLIEDLLESQWWRYAFPQFADLPLDEPREFLTGLKRKIKEGQITSFEPNKVDVYHLISGSEDS